MERSLNLRTKDGHVIYGVLNSGRKKSNTLVIFVHGLTASLNQHILHSAAKFFTGKGLDTFRFNLYDGRKNGRTMTKCTLQTHAEDLNKVLGHFRNKYKKICLVGHSKGGPTIVYSNHEKVDAIVLWDPSRMHSMADLMEGQDRKVKYVKSLNGYVFDWGVEMLIGKKMVQDYDKYNPIRDAKNIEKPTKVICASFNGNTKAGKQYYKMLKHPKDLAIVKGASHNFDEEGVDDVLLKETLVWVRKYCT